MGVFVISLEQIKAARAMLNLSQKQLAQKAGLSVATLNNIERGVQLDPKVSTITAIQQALESKGIDFTDEYEGIGVRLKPSRSHAAINTILIVDDSVEDRTLYKHWLARAAGKKYRVVEADNARSGYGAFAEYRPDCIVLDFKMQGMDGFQLLTEIKKDHTKLPPVVFVTGLNNNTLKEGAERQGVSAYLDKKNMTKEGFYEAIERALA
jgi:CheY-like chemotaxis protein/DNA-binding Xre family transcriptional regulator